ncbi:Cytokinin-O-glucosyltransferase 2 [Hordeum vulgare]|nr:Cytokinin-O-glucosyltransferase 2 [Hordeum vulgare]
MSSPSDAHSAASGGGAAAGNPDLGDFFDQLDLNDEDFDDVEIDVDDPEINGSVRWLALARVHTEKNFSQSVFYKDMRAAWLGTQRRV